MKTQIIFLSVLFIHFCWVKGVELPDDFCRGNGNATVPHPDNCFQFIVCNFDAAASVYTCPVQTPVFNFTRCVEGHVETCSVGVTTTTEPETEPESSTVSESSTELETEPETTTSTTIPTTTTLPTGPPELCDGINLRLIPNPDYCFRFYFCNFGTAVPYECAPNTIFSEESQGCIDGDWLTCEAHTTTSTTTPVRLPTTTPIPIHRCPPGGFGYIPHHTNCSRYFECIKGIRHMRFCPDGLLFDSVTLQCKSPELAVCAGGK